MYSDGAKFVGTIRNDGVENAEGIELRAADRELFDILRSLQIDVNSETMKRLMLLNTRRRNLGRIIQDTDQGTDKDNQKVGKRIGTHLEHSLNLVKACDIFAGLFPPEWREKYLTKIKQAAILHDIGKTGPAEASLDEQKTFIRLFSIFPLDYNVGKEFKTTPIGEAIKKHCLPEEQTEMFSNLSGLGLSPDQLMGEIFGRHVDYTYRILKSIPNLDPEIIFLAASHHRGLHNYPYKLTEDELSALLPAEKERAEDLDTAASIIELADVYEAFSSRGSQKDHSRVIEEMIRVYRRAAEKDPSRSTKELDILERMQTKG